MLVKTLLTISSLLVVLYSAIVAILSFDTPQRCIMFLHWVKFPLSPKFDKPELYGFGRNLGRNLEIKTNDNITIGAWHFLPRSYYDELQLREAKTVNEDMYDKALADPKYDTILYFHGNALHRAASWRVDLYKQLSLRFKNMNIIAIDYRGFGDSDSIPSEAGLRIDAQSTLEWLNNHGVPNSRISIIGHSLGTGVATTLAHDMTLSGAPPKSLILKAGYSSMTTLVFEYNIIPYFPILAPLKKIPALEKFVLSKLNHKFDSLSRIQYVNCPILIIYGTGDSEIPITNSHALFERALLNESSKDLPSLIATMDALVEQKIVVRKSIPNEAVTYKATERTPTLIMVELLHAHHNNIGYFDYTFEAISQILE